MQNLVRIFVVANKLAKIRTLWAPRLFFQTPTATVQGSDRFQPWAIKCCAFYYLNFWNAKFVRNFYKLWYLANFKFKSPKGSTCPATKAKSGSHFGMWKGLVPSFKESPCLHNMYRQVSGACKVTFGDWEKMAKSRNLPKWYPYNSGWTSLFFGPSILKFWRKKLWTFMKLIISDQSSYAT